MPKQKISKTKDWYVIHTYSGYEEAVARNLRQRVESMGMENEIFEILVPKEKKIKIRDGKRKVVEEKVYPGYVLVNMIVTDDSWYVVRNTPNVTGFVGAGITPRPVPVEEIMELKKKMSAEEPEYKIDFRPGDSIHVIDGPFKGSDGKVAGIDEKKGKIKVLINMFGRDTPVEIDSLQAKKI